MLELPCLVNDKHVCECCAAAGAAPPAADGSGSPDEVSITDSIPDIGVHDLPPEAVSQQASPPRQAACLLPLADLVLTLQLDDATAQP